MAGGGEVNKDGMETEIKRKYGGKNGKVIK